MIPGELLPQDGDPEPNAGRPTVTIAVADTGDRPAQINSHYHFYEVNDVLRFDHKAARGFRLNTAAGTTVCFEPGQGRTVEPVTPVGNRAIYGFADRVIGKL